MTVIKYRSKYILVQDCCYWEKKKRPNLKQSKSSAKYKIHQKLEFICENNIFLQTRTLQVTQV